MQIILGILIGFGIVAVVALIALIIVLIIWSSDSGSIG